MQRWTYFLISQRLKNGGKEQYRNRKSKLRIVLNILGYIAAAAVLGYVCYYGGIVAFLVGGAFFFSIAALLISMHVGKEMLLTQSCIVKEQLNNNLPISFSKKRAVIGFLLSFIPIYLMLFVSTLVPGGYLWIIPYMPFFIIALLLSHMSHGFVEIFNFNKHKYNACHVLAHLFVLIVGSTIRLLLLKPN